MTAPSLAPPRWWQWPTVLSLDAPFVAVVWQSLFGALAGVEIRWPEVTVLGLSVWLAYAADRWLEGRRLPAAQIVTPRHRFYAEHDRPLRMAWLIVLAIDLTVAFTQLGARELTAGSLLLAAVVAYVLSHQLIHRERRWRLPKEILIAVLIASGASVFVVAGAGVSRPLLAGIALFAAACFVNVALIAVWEEEVDEIHGQSSLARQFTHAAAIIHLLPLALTGLAVFAAVPVLGVAPVVAHCVAASAVLLALLDRYEPKLGWKVARVLADAALLTPALPLLKGWRS